MLNKTPRNTLDGIVEFFSPSTKVPTNDEVKDFHDAVKWLKKGTSITPQEYDDIRGKYDRTKHLINNSARHETEEFIKVMDHNFKNRSWYHKGITMNTDYSTKISAPPTKNDIWPSAPGGMEIDQKAQNEYNQTLKYERENTLAVEKEINPKAYNFHIEVLRLDALMGGLDSKFSGTYKRFGHLESYIDENYQIIEDTFSDSKFDTEDIPAVRRLIWQYIVLMKKRDIANAAYEKALWNDVISTNNEVREHKNVSPNEKKEKYSKKFIAANKSTIEKLEITQTMKNYIANPSYDNIVALQKLVYKKDSGEEIDWTFGKDTLKKMSNK